MGGRSTEQVLADGLRWAVWWVVGKVQYYKIHGNEHAAGTAHDATIACLSNCENQPIFELWRDGACAVMAGCEPLKCWKQDFVGMSLPMFTAIR